MASKAILTTRELKNKVTGIDLMVPDYEETQGKISKGALYHVIVITRLFYYKSKMHKESDAVQFMVSKKYEEFEDLYHKLNNRFPSVLFPDLPKKPLLVNSTTFHERRKVMDEVMHMVARTQKLCCSPMILEFLGVRKPSKQTVETITVSEDIFEEKNVEETQNAPEEADGQEPNNSQENTEGREEEPDLFVAVDLDSSAALEPESEDAFTAAKSTKLELHASLFEDEIEGARPKDDSDLFMPPEAKVDNGIKVDLGLDENTDDLLDVDEDFDDLLALSKKSEKKSSIKAPTSARPSIKPKPSSRTSFESQPDDEDLTLLASSKAPQKIKEDDDFFTEARKKPTRDKREKLVKADTLDDIFEKASGDKNIFSKNSTDDDLFTSKTSKSDISSVLDQDDITKYINENLSQDSASLEL